MVGTFLSRNLEERDVFSGNLHGGSYNFAICKAAVSRGGYLKKKVWEEVGGGLEPPYELCL